MSSLIHSKIQINALGFLISHGICIVSIILGYELHEPLIPIAILGGLFGFGMFQAWRKK